LKEEPLALTEEQRGAFEYAMSGGDIKALAVAAATIRACFSRHA